MIRLDSKRHHVYLKDNKIYKYFQDIASYEGEKKVLESYDPLRIIKCDNDKMLIIMTYIKGTSLLDILESCEKHDEINEFIEICLEVFESLNRFHKTFNNKLRFYDMNFKNILYDDQVYLIDFETVRPGDIRQDYIAFVAMLVMYNPIKSDFKMKVKKELLSYLSKTLDLNLSHINELFKSELEQIHARRQ